MGGIGWGWMRSRSGGSIWLRSVGTLLALLFVPAVFGLLPWHWRWLHAVPVEGVIGRIVAGSLVVYLNMQGAWLVASVLAVAGVYFAFAVSFWAIKQMVEDRWIHLMAMNDRWRNWREERAEAKSRARSGARRTAVSRTRPEALLGSIGGDRRRSSRFTARSIASSCGTLLRRRAKSESPIRCEEIPAFQRAATQPAAAPSLPEIKCAGRASGRRAATEAAPAPAGPVPVPVPAATQTPLAPLRPVEARPAPAPVRTMPPPQSVPPAPAATEAIAIHERADADIRTVTVAPKHVSGFKLPASTLLNAGTGPQAVREDELREEARVLVEKCAEFDVRGQVVQINPGPMVTTYEFKPEAGVKYSRVTGLAEDLCLAMRAESILIERMAGKSTVGIQVPNHERETIHLRDVLESETFSKAKSRLTLAMGKDINGRIVTADLASMPHVLIAGSTGSGKSVAINAMIMSLLFRTTPQQVRLILVDPKRVELGMYEGIPHLFTPIITEPKLAANALRNAVREMERRLKLLASRSVRNIDQYNKLI